MLGSSRGSIGSPMGAFWTGIKVVVLSGSPRPLGSIACCLRLSNELCEKSRCHGIIESRRNEPNFLLRDWPQVPYLCLRNEGIHYGTDITGCVIGLTKVSSPSIWLSYALCQTSQTLASISELFPARAMVSGGAISIGGDRVFHVYTSDVFSREIEGLD